MPIYANINRENVKDKLLNMGCKLYNNGEMFYSGCLVSVDKNFEATVYYKDADENGKEKVVPIKQEVPVGIFKMRTIMSSGQVKLENNCGLEILSSDMVLTKCGLQKYKN